MSEQSTYTVAPLAPPADWFNAPEPDEPTPLKVTADGRVYGHLAPWDGCHAGMVNGTAQSCVKPPRSMTDYKMFHLGELELEDGSSLPVGKVIVSGSHASTTRETTLQAAISHYDKTGSVAAFVRARNGKHGIFLSGAVKSDISPEQLRDLRANLPSGDWRNLDHNLELIGALAVPVPGFGIPAIVASADSGEIDALILQGFCAECEDDGRDRSYLRRRETFIRAIGAQDLEPMVAATLTSERRNRLQERAFAVPAERKFPIHDATHARNALARAAGTKYEAQVRRAVCKRYPDMGECGE